MGGVELQNRSSGSGCRYEVHPVLESLVCNSSTETDRVMKSRLLLKKKSFHLFCYTCHFRKDTQTVIKGRKKNMLSSWDFWRRSLKKLHGSSQFPRAWGLIKQCISVGQIRTGSVAKACDSVVCQALESWLLRGSQCAWSVSFGQPCCFSSPYGCAHSSAEKGPDQPKAFLHSAHVLEVTNLHSVESHFKRERRREVKRDLFEDLRQSIKKNKTKKKG